MKHFVHMLRGTLIILCSVAAMAGIALVVAGLIGLIGEYGGKAVASFFGFVALAWFVGWIADAVRNNVEDFYDG